VLTCTREQTLHRRKIIEELNAKGVVCRTSTKPIAVAMIAAAAVVLSRQGVPQLAMPAIALTHVNIIDATGSPATRDMTVIIRRHRHRRR